MTSLVNADEGLVSANIFMDDDIYRAELARVFEPSWLFVAHESELPRPGSFVTRWMAEDPVIVCRGSDGQIRVLLNTCRHRGRGVCSEDLGQTTQFRCGYHGWTYNTQGELVGVPLLDGYQGRLDQAALGLVQAPRVESTHGLVFASWAESAPPLSDYIGPMSFVFDLLFGRSEGLEVVGPPVRWLIPGNWKLAAANFAGDGHHIFTTHGFRTALNLETIRGERLSYVLPSDYGHACTLSCWPKGVTDYPYSRLPEAIWPELKEHLSEDQLDLLANLAIMVGNIFPNCSFLQTASHLPDEWGGSPSDPPVSFLTIRQWQPRGANQMEVWSWQLVDRNAPERWKEVSRQCFTREFGPGGVFEQDDAENWSGITATLKSPAAKRLTLQYRMGLKMDDAQQWPGPGTAYFKRSFEEFNERVFYAYWHKLMQAEVPQA